MEWFRPQVWLLDLDTIANGRGFTSVADLLSKARQDADADVRRVTGQVLQPDEYLITDLKDDEFIIIIDG